MNLIKIFNTRIIIGCLVLVVFLFVAWHWLSYKAFLQKPMLNQPDKIVITIKSGTGVNSLAANWYQQGWIESPYYLRLLAWLEPDFKLLKQGEYHLKSDDTPLTMLEKIAQGKVIQYSFTIVEGMNSFQLLDAIQQFENLKNDLELNPLQLQQILGIESSSIEGWFYPDTYHFSKGASGISLLKRAYQKMQTVLSEEWDSRAVGLPYANPYEALIMASIIEKETGVPSERGQIAGVFVRRLEKKMRLQTDPTVIYGIGPTFDGDITYKHLRTLTPYNTYKIKGLPPTPIALPGRESIHAALNPVPGDTLYFVATGDGGHYFSKTLEEHNKAVKRYLLKR